MLALARYGPDAERCAVGTASMLEVLSTVSDVSDESHLDLTPSSFVLRYCKSKLWHALLSDE